jgi:hypothetical protein
VGGVAGLKLPDAGVAAGYFSPLFQVVTMTGPTRRQVLRRAGVTAGAVAALAGCTNDTGRNGGDGSGGSDGGTGGSPSGDDSTDTGGGEDSGADTAYGAWLLPPEEGESDRYIFRSSRPQRLRSLESSLGDVDLEQFSGTVAPGVPWTDVAAFHRVPGAVVLTGDLSVGEWQSSLTDREFAESETYRGFSLYTRDGGGAVGFGDGTVVVNQSSASGLATVRTVIDANNGEVATGPEADEAVGAVVAALGNGELVSGGRVGGGSPFERASVAGQRFAVGEDETEYRAAVVFENEGAVDADRLGELVGASELFAGPDAVTVERQGRTAVATGTLATGDVSTFSPNLQGEDAGETPPQVQFQFESDGEGTLTITHAGGDNVPAAELYIRGSGFVETSGVDMTGPGQWQGTADDGEVAAGDSVTVGVSGDWEVLVVWQTEDGGRSATLARQSA